MADKIKPGVYRNEGGHTVEYFEGATVIPPGYEFVATAEDFAKPGDSDDDSKARRSAQNKARPAPDGDK